MKYSHFLLIFLTTGCVVPGYIPRFYEEPIYYNLDEVVVLHIYAPSPPTEFFEGFEILVDGEMGNELENGEIKVTVSPGNHNVTFGTYIGSGGGYVAIVRHKAMIKPIEKHFYPGETYYIRFKRSPKWSERISYPNLQLTNKQMYDVEYALFRGLKTYDAAQKAYVEKNCNSDIAKVQNSKINTPSNSCGSESSFDFHVKALEEVNSNLFEWNVWDKALDEVRGDQNKQLAKYIELRSDQLYAERTGEIFDASLYKQAILKTDSGRLSGGYHSSITPNKTKKSSPVVFLSQGDDKVTGVFYPNKGDRIDGSIDGKSIKILWTQPGARHYRTGALNVSSDGTKLEGYWFADSNTSDRGKWTLTKLDNVGSESGTSLYQQAASVTPDTPIDISGTYHSNISTEGYDGYWALGRDPYRKVILKQNNDKIIGTFSGSRSGDIEGILNGDTIKFKWFVTDGLTESGRGEWEVTSDGINWIGTWRSSGRSIRGNWNLTKSSDRSRSEPLIHRV